MTTKRLTAEDLAVIEVRANAATGGEWLAYEPMEFHGDIRIAKARDEYPDGSPKNTYVGRLVESHVGREKPRREDGAFIAAARTDVPDLIAEVRALTAERDELRAIVEGRKVAPTEAEFAELRGAGGSCTVSASYGDGACRVLWSSREGMALMLREAEYVSTRGYVVAWRAFDASGRPCAWPKVTP